MKISGLEKGILALTAAFLLLTAGYYLGQRSAAQPYTVAAQTLWAQETADTPEPTTASEEPTDAPEDTPSALPSAAPSEDPAHGTGEGEETPSGDRRVNINTASAEELQTLPGIGQARAEAIIADREANGPFRVPEDITRVSGIGEGILANIIEHITVE